MSRRASPSAQKRTTAIKRADGDPLTRFDIQYDVLHHIFHDVQAVFTDPYDSAAKVTFRDLYIRTILHSQKATKTLKDKMTESATFAEDFAMLALLVNRTTGNLQDAPRIKHILKSANLGNCHGPMPSTPADILSRVKSGQVPSTTVMNLVFVFANHSGPIGRVHFSEKLDFTDLFICETLSSLSRARAFLWLCYHYLESSVEDSDDDYDNNDGPTNPFADSRRGNIPTLVHLTDSEIAQENVDPEEENKLGEKLVLKRLEIVKAQGAKELSKHNKMSGSGIDGIGDEDRHSASARESFKLKIRRDVGKQVTKEMKTSSIVLSSHLQEETGKNLGHSIPHTDQDHDLVDSSLCFFSSSKAHLIQTSGAPLQVVPSISIHRQSILIIHNLILSPVVFPMKSWNLWEPLDVNIVFDIHRTRQAQTHLL
ncbi:hypothetical protein C0992_002387 [Termitomyces sp. T32_za158]|nr:hypothetical protein C0992_002387 [Termitomyces sp. T32_za158]